MKSRPTVNRLRDQLEKKALKSVETKRLFIPPTVSHSVFTEQDIILAVRELDCEEHDKIGLASTIYNEGVVTFAILVWMRCEDYIVFFRNHEGFDKLPMSEIRARMIAPDIGGSFAKEVQWQFIPYHFKADMCDYHRIIDDADTIFPFIGEVIHIATGGQGEISQLELVSSLQDLISSKNNTVKLVRKTIVRRFEQEQKAYDEMFTREMRCLRLLHRLRHPNIVPLLGSYTHENRHNFLFPWLEMDLGKYFQAAEQTEAFRFDFDIFFALCGLASALERTHDLFLEADKHGLDFEGIGYHHDFRPQNILVSGNTFLLADFGLAKLKPADSKSETGYKVGAGDYIAPECMDENFVSGTVGRAIDVWAFGCLLTEIITFTKLGKKGLEQFRKERLSPNCTGWNTQEFFFSVDQVKPSIISWIESLRAQSSPPVLEILNLAEQALQVFPKKRPRICEIRRALAVCAFQLLVGAVNERMESFLKDALNRNHQDIMLMRIWLEKEKIRVLGTLFSTDEDQVITGVIDVPDFYEICKNAMLALFHIFDSIGTGAEGIGAEVRDVPQGHQVDLRDSFEERIQGLVRNLWRIIPAQVSRKAEIAWLESVESNKLSFPSSDADITAAYAVINDLGNEGEDSIDLSSHDMARMKAIRLYMLGGFRYSIEDLLHSTVDLTDKETVKGHRYARFKISTRVLVEWMHYRPSWANIPISQMTMIMQLKAQGFNVHPKPPGLRLLKCLGFVEESQDSGKRQGYGFLYEIPANEFKSGFVTSFYELLTTSLNPQNVDSAVAGLEGKFRLAYALASFFGHFHAMGWLHENFNSRNVIFSATPDELFGSSAMWSQPYVVGLQKSRPEGKSFHTEGPSDDISLVDYEHPDYRKKKRFLREYDYYSLGVVLLEIGLWFPLMGWSQRPEYRRLRPEEFRQLLISRYAPRLKDRMGESYCKAVVKCLDGSLSIVKSPSQVSPEEVDKVVFGNFLEDVLLPLRLLSSLEL